MALIELSMEMSEAAPFETKLPLDALTWQADRRLYQTPTDRMLLVQLV